MSGTAECRKRKISVAQKIALLFLGLFISILLLEIGLRVGGVVYLALQERQNRISMRKRGLYRIVCLGESTTAMDGKYSYPSQLEDILNERNIGIKFCVINKGYIAGRMGGIVSQVEDILWKYNPDMVITMLGINDEMDVLQARADNKMDEYVCPPENANFINSLRTYKLARLIRQRLASRSEDRGILKSGEEMDLTPGDYESYVKSGRYYRKRAEYEKAEWMLKKAMVINDRRPEAHIEYGWLYTDLGDYDKAKTTLKRALELNPENGEILTTLGRRYLFDDNWETAGSLFKRAISANPKNVDALIMLGACYDELGKLDQAEKVFRGAIDIEPGNTMAYIRLGLLHAARKEDGKAEDWLQKAVDANPNNYMGYFELGQFYMSRKEFAKAEVVLSKAIAIHPQVKILYDMLNQVYREGGVDKCAEERFRKANTSILEEYSPIVTYHYRRLKEIVTRRGIKLVCVQYPVCNVEPLKRMLGEDALIYFVDNERVFKDALKKGKNEEYFTDNFAGGFGHCTPKGNRLLAENVAKVILRDCLAKKSEKRLSSSNIPEKKYSRHFL